MKRFFLLLAAWCCLGLSAALAYNPYAPNQFDAVDRNTWEYKAVYDLSKAGLTGVPMTRFAPSYNLTRYEATADQQREIDKLAQSYADDLQYVSDAPKEAEPSSQGVVFDWKGDKA